MTVEQEQDNKPVRIDICVVNFSDGYSVQYKEFLKVLWISIKPTEVHLIYPSGIDIHLQSVNTFERFCEIIERISCIYHSTEQFFT
jgi:hypothetical protein